MWSVHIISTVCKFRFHFAITNDEKQERGNADVNEVGFTSTLFIRSETNTLVYQIGLHTASESLLAAPVQGL